MSYVLRHRMLRCRTCLTYDIDIRYRTCTTYDIVRRQESRWLGSPNSSRFSSPTSTAQPDPHCKGAMLQVDLKSDSPGPAVHLESYHPDLYRYIPVYIEIYLVYTVTDTVTSIIMTRTGSPACPCCQTRETDCTIALDIADDDCNM
jgi:hypothetical protein